MDEEIDEFFGNDDFEELNAKDVKIRYEKFETLNFISFTLTIIFCFFMAIFIISFIDTFFFEDYDINSGHFI